MLSVGLWRGVQTSSYLTTLVPGLDVVSSEINPTLKKEEEEKKDLKTNASRW